MVKEVLFKTTSEHQLIELGMTKTSMPLLNSVSQKLEPRILTLPERLVSRDFELENKNRRRRSDRGSRKIA